LLKCSSVFCPVRKLFYDMLTASCFFLNLCRFLILLSFLKQNMMSPYFVLTFSPLQNQTLLSCKLATSSTVAIYLYKGCSPFSFSLFVVEKSTMWTVFSIFELIPELHFNLWKFMHCDAYCFHPRRV